VDDGVLGAELRELPGEEQPVLFGDQRHEAVADQLLLRLLEVPAVDVVDEGQRAIHPEAANELGLVLDDAPVARLALPQGGLHPPLLGELPLELGVA
jgi:hypothetical protein